MTTTAARPGVFVSESLQPLQSSSTGIPGAAVPAFAAAYDTGPVRPVLVTSWQQYVSLYGGFNVAGGSPLAYAVYSFFANGGSACYVLRVANTDAVTASLLLQDVSTTAETPVLTVSAASPGLWGNNISVEVVPVAGTSTQNVTFNVYQNGVLAETWPDVSVSPSSTRNISALVNSTVSGSQYVTVTETLPATGYAAGETDLAALPPTALAGGADGTTAPELAAAVPTAYDQLQDQLLVLNLPGVSDQATLNTVINWAQGRGDVFLVIDGPFGGTPVLSSAQVTQNYVNMVSGSTPLNAASCAAIYAPWLSVPDPASSVPGATRWVAPGGAVLGVFAASDAQSGVQQTPAGITANVGAVQLEATFTATDLDALEAAQVNPVKYVPSHGYCIFGGRTLMPGYPNRYINVSRVLQQFVHDMTYLTEYAIFENNDAALWASITTVLTNYFQEAMQAGVLAGNTPDTAYSVTCDDTINTPSSAQAGIVNVQVAVALVSPAEFILISLSQQQGTTTATVTT